MKKTRGLWLVGTVAFAFAVSLALGASARGAELFYMDHDAFTTQYVGAVGPLVISGDIEPGDFDRVLQKIADDQPRFLAQNKIILASQEGDVAEAIKVAALVKSLHAAVSVGPMTGKCVGACFLIYAAAGERVTDGEHLLGVYALGPIGTYLAVNGVPQSLAEEMARHEAARPYWLSAADEQALGVRSPAFAQYLKKNCAWDDTVERSVYAGKRPLADFSALLACRTRVTQADARQALAAALKDQALRIKGAAAKKSP